MTGQELLNHVRINVLRDSRLPYLWSDDLILLRLNEAERAFCRETYALLDDTQTITTVIGTPTYSLPLSGALFVFSAAVSTESRDLASYTRRFIPTNLLTATGTPRIFTNDEATRKVRFYPVPDAVITINLRIARLPLEDIALNTSPEIPSEYHLDLTKFVAWQCLQDNDVDGESSGSATRHEKEWNLCVESAKYEYYRYRLGNNPRAVFSCTSKRN